MPRVMLCIPPEELEDVLHAQLGHSFTFNGCGGQSARLFLEIKDTFLNAVGNSDFVDDNVDCLIETVDTVNGLFFHKLLMLLASFQVSL